jgi:hypothetical protein
VRTVTVGAVRSGKTSTGVEPGERVVTDGAYAVHLASLNTSEIGHGHAH